MSEDLFTPEQNEQIAEAASVARAVARSELKRYKRNATVGFITLCLGIGGAFYTGTKSGQESRAKIVSSGTTLAQNGCRGREADHQLLADVLRAAEASTRTTKYPGETEAARRAAIQFYETQIAHITKPLGCSSLRVSY